MSVLKDRVSELITQHGSLRAAAAVLGLDAGYLSRIGSGEKTEPGKTLLRRMGLRRVVTYERIAPVGREQRSPMPNKKNSAPESALSESMTEEPKGTP